MRESCALTRCILNSLDRVAFEQKETSFQSWLIQCDFIELLVNVSLRLDVVGLQVYWEPETHAAMTTSETIVSITSQTRYLGKSCSSGLDWDSRGEGTEWSEEFLSVGGSAMVEDEGEYDRL